MAKRFLTPINVNSLSSDPEVSSSGDLYYNTVLDKLKVYANSSWVEIGKSQLIVESGSDYPETPIENGKLFYNSSNGRTAINFNNVWKEFAYTTDVPLDGGYYNTTVFNEGIDGGSPSTTVFVGNYNG
jgi:hypothetical protein